MNKLIILWMLTFLIFATSGFATVGDFVECFDFENDTGYNGNFTLNSTGETVVPGLNGNGYEFDSDSDLLNYGFSQSDLGSQYTISCWYKWGTVRRSGLITPTDTNIDGIYFFGDGNALRSQYNYGQLDTNEVADYSFSPNTNDWYMVSGTRGSDDVIRLWINSSNVASSTLAVANTSSTELYQSRDGVIGSRQYLGIIDTCVLYDRALDSSELEEIYDSHSGKSCIEIEGEQGSEFSIIITDTWDNSDILNVSANITLENGTSYLFTNQSGNRISTTIPITINQLADIKITNPNYFDSINYDINMSSNFNAKMNQSVISFIATDILGNAISDGNVTLSAQTNNLSYLWPLSSENYTATFSNYNFLDKEQLISVNILDNRTVEIINVTNSVLTFNDINGIPIQNSIITIEYPSSTEVEYTTDTNGEIYFTTILGNTLASGTYNFTFNGRDGFQSPTSFTKVVNATDYFVNETYSIDTAGFNISIRDSDTGGLISSDVDITILGFGGLNTSNGTLFLKNSSLASSTYTIFAVADGYSLGQSTFSYDARGIEQIDIYLVNSTDPTTGTITTIIYDEVYNLQLGSDVRLLQYFPATDSYVQVDQCFSNSNGECLFNVHLGTTLYVITATKITGGIAYQASSSSTGEIFYLDEYEIELHLFSEQLLPIDDLTGFYVSPQNVTLVNNISYLTGVFYDQLNNIHQVCIRYSYVNNTLIVPLSGGVNCVNASSGEINVFGGYDLTTILATDSVFAEIFVNRSGQEISYFSEVYASELSFQQQAGDLAPYLIMFFWCAILGLALYVKNIYIFSIGNMFGAILGKFMLPSFFTWEFVSILFVLSIVIFYLSRKQEGNIGV